MDVGAQHLLVCLAEVSSLLKLSADAAVLRIRSFSDDEANAMRTWLQRIGYYLPDDGRVVHDQLA